MSQEPPIFIGGVRRSVLGQRKLRLRGEPSIPSLLRPAVPCLNARFHGFLQLLAVASSPSPAERAAFMAFALQRIRAVNLKGTFAIILARPVSRTAPGGVHRRGALPLIQPKPRPRVAACVSPPPRPQPRAAWAGAFPHTERPRCLASASTALLFLLPPHM